MGVLRLCEGYVPAGRISGGYPDVHTEDDVTAPLFARLYAAAVITVAENEKDYVVVVRRSVQSKRDPGMLAFPVHAFKSTCGDLETCARRGLAKKTGVVVGVNETSECRALPQTNTAPRLSRDVYRMYVVVPILFRVSLSSKELSERVDLNRLAPPGDRECEFRNIEEILLVPLDENTIVYQYPIDLHQKGWGEHSMSLFLFDRSDVIRLDKLANHELLHSWLPYTLWGLSGRILIRTAERLGYSPRIYHVPDDCVELLPRPRPHEAGTRPRIRLSRISGLDSIELY